MLRCRTVLLAPLTMLLLAALNRRVEAQLPEGPQLPSLASCVKLEWPNHELRSGALRVPDSIDVDMLRRILAGQTCNYPWVRRYFFGNTYTPNLVDWIVYVDTAGTVKEVLTRNNKVIRTPILRGERSMYFLVFIERGLSSRQARDEVVANLAGQVARRGMTRAQSAALWRAFFDGAGRARPGSIRLLLDSLVIPAHHADPNREEAALFATSKTMNDSVAAMEALLREIARPWDAATPRIPQVVPGADSTYALLDLVINALSQGALPPGAPAPSGAPHSGASVVEDAGDYLSDPANRGRILDALSLLNEPEEKDGPDSLVIRRDVLQAEPDPFMVRLAGSIGEKLFGVSPGVDAEDKLADSTFKIALQDLGPGTGDPTHLYLAFGKVALTDDIWGRINVYPPEGKSIAGTRSVIRNFLTTAGSPFSVTIGLMGFNGQVRRFAKDDNGYAKRMAIDTVDSLKGRPDSTSTVVGLVRKVDGERETVRPFLLLQYHLLPRRSAPLRYRWLLPFESASLIFGSNLTGDAFSTVAVGASLNRVFATPVGIAGAVTWLNEEKINKQSLRVGTQRSARFMGGLTFSF